MKPFRILLLGGMVALCVTMSEAADAELVVPRYKATQILLRPSDHAEKNYYLTPNLVRMSEREILITFKRGASHGWEAEADAEMIRFDPVENRVIEQRTIGHVPGRKFQLTMGTLFGDGSLAMYADFQHTGETGILAGRDSSPAMAALICWVGTGLKRRPKKSRCAPKGFPAYLITSRSACSA